MLSPTWIEWIIPLLVAFALCFHAISLSVIVEAGVNVKAASAGLSLSMGGVGGVESLITSTLQSIRRRPSGQVEEGGAATNFIFGISKATASNGCCYFVGCSEPHTNSKKRNRLWVMRL